MIELSVGTRWRSAACSVELIVVRAPGEPVDLRVGGQPVVPYGTTVEPGPAVVTDGPGMQLGKRYGNAEDTLEILCTKAGSGSPALGDIALEPKEVKALPSSD